LNELWFLSLEKVRENLESRRQDYKENRSHGAPGNATPKEFAAQIGCKKAALKTDIEVVKNELASPKSG